MSTEDRLRAALSDRAGSARTSPDALTSVFGRVARHRRNTRLAAAASVVAVAVAGTAFATTLRSGTDSLQPIGPTASTSPVAPPSPTPSMVVPSQPVFPDDSVVVLLADGRLAVVSTTTGDEIESLGTLADPSTDRFSLDWSPDRRHVYYTSGECRVIEYDVTTKKTRHVADGYRPAAGPVGQVAAVGCQGGIVVTDTESGRDWEYEPSAVMVDDAGEAEEPFAVSVAWLDGTALVAARAFEDAATMALVDRTKERPWDEAQYLDHRADRIVSDDHGTLFASLVNYGNGSAPPTTEFFQMSDLDIERGATAYGREYLFTAPGDVRQLAVDGRGAVLYVDDSGLWRRHDGPPELIKEGVVAVGG